MSKEKRRVPKLRFPGFTEDWEQRKLGDIATITGGGTPSTNISEYWNGDIDWYSPVEIGENRYVSGSTRKITKLGLEKSSAKILPVGTVLFTSRAGIGNTAILQAEGCTNQGFQSITPNSKALDTYFLYTMTPKLKRYGEVTGAGSTFVEVSGKQMEQMNLMIPSLEEQKCVSQIFKAMDDSITLHQRKLEHLNLKKKALLQKLFPKNGECYPELRFPGFIDAWEQRKLGDLYKRVNERNDGTLGRDKWISVAKMYFQDPDKVQSNNLDTRTYVMKKGDIAFEGHPNNEFKFGRFVLNDIGTGIISELFPIYRPITEYDLDFWKYAIQLERVMAHIFAKSITSSGNSSNKLDHNHFLNQELLVPNIEEQKKIGTLLSILSKNITLHQRKLEHLQLQKKALLQQMFV